MTSTSQPISDLRTDQDLLLRRLVWATIFLLAAIVLLNGGQILYVIAARSLAAAAWLAMALPLAILVILHDLRAKTRWREHRAALLRTMDASACYRGARWEPAINA